MSVVSTAPVWASRTTQDGVRRSYGEPTTREAGSGPDRPARVMVERRTAVASAVAVGV